MFENIFGLSCVENQVLAILRKRGEDITPLYYNCAMPLKELFFFMLIKGERQEYFSRMPRVQKDLKSLGIISLTLKKQTDLSLLRRQIRRCSENQYILIRTNPEFSKNRLFARGFRDDHYILAQYEKEGRNYILFNDLPERVLKLPARDFNKAYGGDYFKLEVKRRLNDEDATYLFKKRDFKPEKFIPFYFCECDFADIPNIGERLRNMTGVYKLLRYRFSEYYGDYLESDFIKNALSRIEKYYSIFEYYNLKGDIPYQRYYSHFAELNRLETEIILILKNNMEEKIYAKRNG